MPPNDFLGKKSLVSGQQLHPTRDLKFCVFCGEKPSFKTAEHIIPRWLVEITGDPKRDGRFGPYWNPVTDKFEYLRIPFDQFKFPSCEKCNHHYSNLEVKSKSVIELLLQERKLAQADLSHLLSWLDKIRVGLWLAIFYLHRKRSDIEPHMFIDSRIDLPDRMVLIYKSNRRAQRLNFTGIDTPAFQYNPICFALLINNFVLMNLSTDFLFSKRIGLPYPEKSFWGDWPQIKFSMVRGSQRVRLPLIRWGFNTRCTQIYQPMFTRPGRDSSIYS
jgi:hypothetical protein